MDIQDYLDIIIQRRSPEECESVDYLRTFSGDHEEVLSDFSIHEKCTLRDVLFTLISCHDLLSQECLDYIFHNSIVLNDSLRTFIRSRWAYDNTGS